MPWGPIGPACLANNPRAKDRGHFRQGKECALSTHPVECTRNTSTPRCMRGQDSAPARGGLRRGGESCAVALGRRGFCRVGLGLAVGRRLRLLDRRLGGRQLLDHGADRPRLALDAGRDRVDEAADLGRQRACRSLDRDASPGSSPGTAAGSTAARRRTSGSGAHSPLDLDRHRDGDEVRRVDQRAGDDRRIGRRASTGASPPPRPRRRRAAAFGSTAGVAGTYAGRLGRR